MAGKNAAKRLTNLVDKAALQVNIQNYDGLMDALVSLGDAVYTEVKKVGDNYKGTFDVKANEVRIALQKILGDDFERIASLDYYGFRAFEAVWEDVHLTKSDAESKRYLAAKAALNDSTRHKIKLGLLALGHLARLRKEAAQNEETIKEYNKKAAQAVSSYLTTRQKVLNAIANFFTFGAALTFGLTTFAAILLVPVTWPAVVVFGLASVVGIAGGIVNWNIFKKPVFNFLNDIMGKDSPFEGFTKYITEKGKKASLSAGKKIAVAVSGLLSLSVGAALGALTYVSVLGLSQVSFLSFLAVGVGASILPPVAIALGVVAFVCLTALMLNAFSGMLKTDNVKSIFTKPFQAVQDVFDENIPSNAAKKQQSFLGINRLSVERGVTYAITAALTGLGLFGLGMFSWACAGALTQMLSATLGVVPFIATAVGYGVGIVAAIGQIPFILMSSGQAIANVASKFSDLFAPKSNDVNVNAVPQEKTTFKKVLASAWDGLLVVVNAVGNGALVVPSLISSGLALAFSAAGASFYNSFSAGASSFKAPGPDDQKQANASTARIQRLMGQDVPEVERPVVVANAVQPPLPAPKPAFLYSALMFDRGPRPQGPNGNGGGAAAPVPNLDGEDEAARLINPSI